MHAIHTIRHPIAMLLCFGAFASAHAQITQAAPLPGPGATAAPLRFGTTQLRRYEDIAKLPDSAVIAGPNGAQVTAAQVRRARQAKLAHRAAAKQDRPTAIPARLSTAVNVPRTPSGVTNVDVGLVRPVDITGCIYRQAVALNAGGSICSVVHVRVPGASRIDRARLEGAFPGGPVNLTIDSPDANLRFRLSIPYMPDGTPVQCSDPDLRQPSQDAKLVLETNHPTRPVVSMPLCVLPPFVLNAAPPPPGVLAAMASDPAASIETDGNLLIVRRSAHLEQPYGGEWDPVAAPPLVCFPPGMDTITMPASPMPTQFVWYATFSHGRVDQGSNDAAGGPGWRRPLGSYNFNTAHGGLFEAAGSSGQVNWAVWESLHDGTPPEGDDKVCLSLYGLSFYLEGPAGMPVPPR